MTINYDPGKWISLSEASRLRGVKKQTMSYLVKKGRFETLRIGSNVFVVKEDVASYEPDPGGRPKKKSKNTKVK
jgi:hypothetical protein